MEGVLLHHEAMKTSFVMTGLLSGLYWFDEALQSAFERHGFPPVARTHSLILMNLAIGESRPTRLARNLGVTRQAISQLLTHMQDLGLIVVRRDPNDGRAKIVDFSPASVGIRDTAQSVLLELEDILGKRVGRANLHALRRILAADWGEPPEVALRAERIAVDSKAPRRRAAAT
jgi:DNA-binding MarR family transcriptional regulator